MKKDSKPAEPIERPVFKPRYTHDSAGKPLPSFILNGSVAYAPMVPKVRKIPTPKFE